MKKLTNNALHFREILKQSKENEENIVYENVICVVIQSEGA